MVSELLRMLKFLKSQRVAKDKINDTIIVPPGSHLLVWDKEKIRRYWMFFESNPIFRSNFFSEVKGDDIVRMSKKYLKKGSKVLDVGVGTGALIERLSRLKLGLELHGIDIVESPSVKRLKEQGILRFKIGDATNIPYDNETFDVVFLVEVLEHLLPEEVLLALLEIKRVLKPGGMFIISVPYKENLQYNMIICPECGAIFNTEQHIHSFDEKSVVKLLKSVGFKVLTLKLFSTSFIHRLIKRRMDRLFVVAILTP